jgi:hypothetical protein
VRSGPTGVLILALAAALAAVLTWPASIPAREALDGRPLGTFQLTYYVVAEEGAPGDVPVFGPGCKAVIARTGHEFHDSLALQGTGLLADGRLLNFEQRCPCAGAGHDVTRSCFRELDRGQFPWGRGAYWNGQHFWLQPFRSAAVDPAVIPIGSVIYVPELAGLALPDGTLSNGCLRAEDTGQAILGKHLDWFLGPIPAAEWLRGHRPPRAVTVFADSRRCTRAFP